MLGNHDEGDHDDDGCGVGDRSVGDKDDNDHMENNNRFWMIRMARRMEISNDILSLND